MIEIDILEPSDLNNPDNNQNNFDSQPSDRSLLYEDGQEEKMKKADQEENEASFMYKD